MNKNKSVELPLLSLLGNCDLQNSLSVLAELINEGAQGLGM